MRALTDRQLESRASLGDTPLTGVGSFEGNNSLTASRQLGSFEGNNKVGSFEGNNNNLTNGTILDTEEELAEAGSYIRWRSELELALNGFLSPQATEPTRDPVELDGDGERAGEVPDLEPGVER